MARARQTGLAIVIALLSLACVSGAQADESAAEEETHEPADGAIFGYGWHGLWSGAMVGAGGGYLVGRRDGWRKRDWRPLGLGAGIGALAGASLGLTLGLVDRAGFSGGGYIVRDLSAGGGFGLVLGMIAGGISAAIQREPEHVLFGAALGVIAGAGLGIVAGIVEGVLDARERRDARGPRLVPALAWTRARDGTLVPMPALAGRF